MGYFKVILIKLPMISKHLAKIKCTLDASGC